MRTLRDALVMIFIGYFLVASTLLFSQSIPVAIYLVAVVVMLTTALIVLNHPAANFDSMRGHLRSACLMLAQGLPLVLLLFILFPRFDSPLWSIPDVKGVAKTGLSDSMTMGNITRLVESGAVAFRVKFEGDIPPAADLYWRTMVLWKSDGRRWERASDDYKIAPQAPKLEVRGQQKIGYDITLEATQQRWLPLLDRPNAAPTGLEGELIVTPDYQYYMDRDLTKLAHYTLESVTDYRDIRLDSWAEEAGLQLPKGLNTRAVALAQRWRAEGLADLQMVNRALNYFRDEEFWYSRNPPALGEHSVDQFLFESRRGFCEHYSASFVTLMRAAQIPARVVLGYQGGEVNSIGPLGEYLIVRQSDAHAWSEVWLGDSGWLRIDPTTMIPASRVEAQGDSLRFNSVAAPPVTLAQIAWLIEGWRTLSNSWDAAKNVWNFWVVGFDSRRQNELFQWLGMDGVHLRYLGFMVLGATALLLTLVAMALFYRRERIDPVVARYRRFCHQFNRLGIAYRESETPAQFAQRVIERRPEIADELTRITELYYRLRYRPQRSAAVDNEFQQRINNFRLEA